MEKKLAVTSIYYLNGEISLDDSWKLICINTRENSKIFKIDNFKIF